MQDIILKTIHIDPTQQGSYFTVPFEVPEAIERLSLNYHYPRRPEMDHELPNGRYAACDELNIIDLGLIAPDGRQVGASGSDKLALTVSETDAACCYARSDKEWAVDPSGIRWESFLTHGRITTYGEGSQFDVKAAEPSASACGAPKAAACCA